MRGTTPTEAEALDDTAATLTRVRTLRATAEREPADQTMTLEEYRQRSAEAGR
jgi:hypothetical protein